MRGLIAIAALMGVAVLAHPSGSSATTSTAVGVSEREWSVSLGRLKAPHGRITFYVTNFGQDDHNITIRKHGTSYGSSGRIASGGHATITVRLRPGIYNVFCRIPGHRQLGMAARLTVT
jgi:plastocyanin